MAYLEISEVYARIGHTLTLVIGPVPAEMPSGESISFSPTVRTKSSRRIENTKGTDISFSFQPEPEYRHIVPAIIIGSKDLLFERK